MTTYTIDKKYKNNFLKNYFIILFLLTFCLPTFDNFSNEIGFHAGTVALRIIIIFF